MNGELEKEVEVPIYAEPNDSLFKENKKKLTYEEERAFRLLYKKPFVVNEWEEDGEKYVAVVAP